MRTCEICKVAEVTSTNPDVGYCRWCFYSGSQVEAVCSEMFDALRKAHIQANVYNSGGGCFVMHINVSEDRTKYIWLGWGPEEWDDLWARDEPPRPGWWFNGCVYYAEDEEADTRVGSLDSLQVGADGDVVSIVRELCMQGVTYPLDNMDLQ